MFCSEPKYSQASATQKTSAALATRFETLPYLPPLHFLAQARPPNPPQSHLPARNAPVSLRFATLVLRSLAARSISPRYSRQGAWRNQDPKHVRRQYKLLFRPAFELRQQYAMPTLFFRKIPAHRFPPFFPEEYRLHPNIRQLK